MSSKYEVVAGVKLRSKKPTKLGFRDLFTWTIWQYPRRTTGGLLGAVRPPVSDHGWYPAIIHVKDEHASVYAHLGELFPSPEAAVERLNKSKT